ncbi:MAG: hypothetical protein LN590_01665 [Rickettsia endosymbiont of Glossina mortisans submortisans]|nr:hypothetical protein [Rickettsia endosymbiont of Glossina mortisans submortisans]
MPLFDAINDKHQDIVEFLLENNADPNIGENDRSCLDIAIFAKQDVSLVTTLLAHGANMEFETHGRPLFQRLMGYFINATGNQAKMDIIKVFLQYGANPDILTLGGKAVRDDETIYKPLRTLLTLESAFRKNDYKEIKSINKKDLVAFVQWKSGILPVEKNASKDEYIKSLLELDKFSKQVEEESIKQPLIKCTVKKVADIIRGSVEGTITFDDELTYNTALDLLKKNGFQVQVTGEAEGHIDLV